MRIAAWGLAVATALAACNSGAADRQKAEELRAKAQLEAEHAAEVARKQADEAEKAAKLAMEKAEALAKQVEDLDGKIASAMDAVKAAQTAADRDAAAAKLKQLQSEQAEMRARVGEAKAAAARAQRLKGVSVSKECLDNPLGPGCS